MSVLKIKDENGNVIEIPALKGDKGDKGDTGPQGPQGEKGNTGAAGARGTRGTGILTVTTAPTSYGSTVNGKKTTHRIFQDKVQSESGLSAVVGDKILYKNLLYAVVVINAGSVYLEYLFSMQGAKGDPGQDYTLTEANMQEIANMAKPLVDQSYNPESENAQSGAAVSEAISIKADVEFKAFDTDFSLLDGEDGVHIEPFTRIGAGGFLFFGETKVIIEPFDYSSLTAFNVGDIYRITIVNQQVVSVEKILKIADVDAQLGKIERRFFGPIIPVYDNVTYYATNEISNIEIVYPEGDFICSLTFTTAAEGDITIYLPESKYIGGAPTFGNGETWELNIKNGVVVGGLAE